MDKLLERNKFEIRNKKLVAESSVGVLATLVSGFSLNSITSLKHDDNKNCNCVLWDEAFGYDYYLVLMWINTMFHILTACISGISLIYSTGVYWRGTKILSKRIKDGMDNENKLYDYNNSIINEFDDWWDIR